MLIRLIRFLANLNISRTFIPSVVNERNKLDRGIHSSSSYSLFRKTLLKLIRPVQRKTFNINDSIGVKLLIRLRLGFSYLREHKFRHGFREILNPLCPCSIKAETTTHCFLCYHFCNQKQPSRDVFKKRSSENMQQIYRRTCSFTVLQIYRCFATLLKSHFSMGVLL